MSSNRIEVLVVEDEPLVLAELVKGLEEDPQVKVCGQAEDVESAYVLVAGTPADALFLDIKLIGGDGFDLLRRLKEGHHRIPPVILNTGYEKFEYAQTALNDFKEEVIHILQKPFFENWEHKRQECLEAVISRRENRDEARLLSALGIFSIRNKARTFLLPFEEVQYLEVGGSGTVFVITTDGRELRLNRTMASLLQELPSYILQVSRFNAINVRCLSCIDHETHQLFLKGQERPIGIGDGFYSNLLEILK